MTGAPTPPDPVAALLGAVQAHCAASRALSGMAAGCLDTELPFIGCRPRGLPSLPVLETLRDRAGPQTQALAGAIMAAAPYMEWRQSYTAEQVGQDFLEAYGWFNLVAPDGPYVSATHRVSIGFWGSGLTYPRHWHEPEEIYLVVAGRAAFITDGMEDELLGPGGTRFHPSNVPHAAEMCDGPLLAMAIWRGRGLTDVSTLTPGGEP